MQSTVVKYSSSRPSFVVVALDGLLALFEVGVQLFLLREGDAVDALERFTLAVAAPVGSVAGGQLDAVALDAAGGVEVRIGAEVGELALLVEADDGVLGQVVDELDLERLVLLLHELDGFLARQLKALELELSLQILRISASICSRCSGVKAKGASRS